MYLLKPVSLEHVELSEGVFVQQQSDSLSGSQLALRMLSLDSTRTATLTCHAIDP